MSYLSAKSRPQPTTQTKEYIMEPDSTPVQTGASIDIAEIANLHMLSSETEFRFEFLHRGAPFQITGKLTKAMPPASMVIQVLTPDSTEDDMRPNPAFGERFTQALIKRVEGSPNFYTKDMSSWVEGTIFLWKAKRIKRPVA